MTTSDADACIQLNEFYFSFHGLVKQYLKQVKSIQFYGQVSGVENKRTQKTKY